MARSIATWLGIAVLCAGAGCAHMTVVRPLPPEKESEVNGLISDRVAVLTMQGEPRTLISKDVRLDGNSVRFRASDPASPAGEAWLPETEKPLASVLQIEVRDHGSGALSGLKAGAGMGAVVGLIALLSVKGSEECYRCIFAVPIVGGAALVFGLLGAALGGAAGAPKVIEFKDAPSR